ncbi:MAG: metallophosphoesterase, partial [Pseudomonadales bacterium]|nr:metallophosphoesterase [Pseudomonadales bacterium]
MYRKNWTAHAGRAARRAGAIGVGASLMTLAGTANAGVASNFELVILHHNDGESQLIDAGSGLEDFGGIARFKTVVDNLRAEAALNGRPVLTVTSGDNFLAGPEFNASLENGAPYYDTIALDLIGYDAMCLGNHDFDFGPQVLSDFITGFTNNWPFLSANIDFSGEPVLQSLVNANRIAPSTVVVKDGEQIGIIGATTPNLPFISSPGDVVVDADVAGAIQTQVALLQGQGVNKIIVISHLQSVQEDIDLIAEISGVDIVIAGGGDNLLANAGDLLVPGDTAE